MSTVSPTQAAATAINARRLAAVAREHRAALLAGAAKLAAKPRSTREEVELENLTREAGNADNRVQRWEKLADSGIEVISEPSVYRPDSGQSFLRDLALDASARHTGDQKKSAEARARLERHGREAEIEPARRSAHR